MIENQQMTKLKVLSNDNGLKFVLDQLNEFCMKEGIRRHKIVVGTLQQNGLPKRMNRTILEWVKCMLLGDRLANSF